MKILLFVNSILIQRYLLNELSKIKGTNQIEIPANQDAFRKSLQRFKPDAVLIENSEVSKNGSAIIPEIRRISGRSTILVIHPVLNYEADSVSNRKNDTIFQFGVNKIPEIPNVLNQILNEHRL